jgi:molecular chaperone DnaK (HSP70)
MSEAKDVLHVGIDLGTSRSSISASNGQRHVVESYVGWPLDMVARRRSTTVRCSTCTARSKRG